MVIGLIGYISVGEKKAKVVDLIIYRDKLGKTDYFMNFGKFILILTLFVNLAINTFPIKTMIGNLLKWEISSWRNVVLSLLCSGIPVILACIFQNISDYVRISGCLTGSIIIFIIPGAIAIKRRYCKSTYGHVLIWIWTLSCAFFITVLCTYYTTVLILNEKSKN